MKPYYEDKKAGIVLYHGDCREVLPTIAAGSVDAIVTDPPYGTGGWRRNEAGAGRNPSAKLVKESWDSVDVSWVTGDVPFLSFWSASFSWCLLPHAKAVGLPKHRALYMRKKDPKPMPGGRTKWSVEPIWVLSNEGFVLYGGDDVIDVSTPRMGRDDEANDHPYQKPIEAMHWLVGKLPPDCKTILDPFAGSGTTLRAAKDLGRKAIGIELEERYCEIAANRLRQEVLQFGGDE